MTDTTTYKSVRVANRRAFTLTILSAILVISTFSMSVGVRVVGGSAPTSPSSWNPMVSCTPLVVRIEDITANQTGSTSFSASPFTPGITTNGAGEAKRWLTPGRTPLDWVSPGPACTVTNSLGTTSLFVQINGLERSSYENEDFATNYDPINGGTTHASTGDTTFNIFDPNMVPNYPSSCTAPAESTCYGRIHAEIDHDWKAAGYCGTGTLCDNTTLASQTSANFTKIDVQGFISWDPDHLHAQWHQFNGWEIHPLTAWKLSSTPPPSSVTFSWSPTNPQVGQPTIFTATASNGTTPSTFSWDFGDGVTAYGSSVSHIYVTPLAFTVQVSMTDTHGVTSSTQKIVPVGSWNPAVSCAPSPTTLERIVGNITIQRTPTNLSTTGADYSGGGFRLDGSLPYGSNPINWPFFKRNLQPPCSVNGTPALVEFHDVTVTDVNVDGCSTKYSTDNGGGPYPNGWQSCDVTFNLVTPGFGDPLTCPGCYLHRIYAGIDMDWNASGVAPHPAPIEGERIDVQGFIFWNNDFVNATWHSYSGWEIHPLTAWRPTRPAVTASATFNPSNPTAQQIVAFTGAASGGTGPYSFTWDFGDGTVATGNLANHTYAPGTYIVHMAAADSVGTVGVASQTVTVSPSDFSISTNPGSVTIPSKSSAIASINISSLAGFSGNVSLTVLAPSEIPTSLNPTTLTLGPGGSASSNLTLSTSTPGSYSIVVTGTSGSLSRSATFNVIVTDLNPTVSFTESTTSTLRNQPVTLTISSSDPDGTITSLRVDWGDGAIDGLPGNTTSDTHVYSASGIFTVNVTATDNGGLTTSATAIKTITDAPPLAKFTETATTSPTGTPITFDASTSSDPDGHITNYVWDFGDGSTGTGITVGHSYSVAGIYVVTLTVTDDATLATSSTSLKTITDRPPNVNFTESATTAPTGTPIILSISGSDPDGTVASLKVVWGDGTIDNLSGNATSASHAYPLAGIYQVYVNATDNANLTSMSTVSLKTITDRPPTLTFNEDTTTAKTGGTITLTITSSDIDGTVTSTQVNWGDGTINNLPGATTSDSHSYIKAGTYTVTMTVMDNSGNIAGSQATKIIMDVPPTISFTENSTTATTGQTITLNISSSDSDGAITQTVVDWGDGTIDILPGSATTDSHAYTNTGDAKNQQFTVTVAVTDDASLTGTASAVKTINDLPPSLSFTETKTSTLTLDAISLSINSSDPDGSITTTRVDWGDGHIDTFAGTATGSSHSYAVAGIYTIAVTVTDNAGNSAVQTTVKTINDRSPTASFTESSSSVETGVAISLDASTSFDLDGSIVGYAWNFGDGSTGFGIAAAHSFARAGNYTVVLGVTDDSGLASFSSVVETVLDRAPTAAFTYTPANPLTGQTVSYDGSSSSDPDGTVASFAWSFGDGGTGNGASLQHAYATNGTFTVVLAVTDDNGSTATTSATVTVGNDPAPVFPQGSSLIASHIGPRSLTLTWTPAADNVQVTAYRVYMNGTILSTLPGNDTSYTVNGLTPLEHYLFQVEAGNPSGNYSSNGPSTQAFTDLQGDVNHDCIVDLSDLVLVGSSFGSRLGETGYNPNADLNHDGIIDLTDLILVSSNFGQTC